MSKHFGQLTHCTVRRSLAGVAIVGVLAFSGSAEATGNTEAVISLSGTVPQSCVVSLDSSTGGAVQTFSDLSQSVTNQLVGTINEKCNDRNGYKVTLATANGTTNGVLKEAAGSDTLSYSVQYGGSPVTFASGSAQVTNTTAKTGGTGINKAVTISFAGDPSLNADTYSDTLTITIVAN